jgi:hypothetical protein
MSPQLARDLANAGLLEAPASGLYIDTKRAAKILGISSSFLNKARLDGSGPPFTKLGFHVRYNVQTLLAWAESRTHHSTSEAA